MSVEIIFIEMLSISKLCMTNILEFSVVRDFNINLKCYYNYMQFHRFAHTSIDRSRSVYQRCPIQLANPLVFPDLLMLPQSWMKCLCIYSEHSDISMYSRWP